MGEQRRRPHHHLQACLLCQTVLSAHLTLVKFQGSHRLLDGQLLTHMHGAHLSQDPLAPPGIHHLGHHHHQLVYERL